MDKAYTMHVFFSSFEGEKENDFRAEKSPLPDLTKTNTIIQMKLINQFIFQTINLNQHEQ